MKKLDLFTRQRYLLPTLAPIWSALPAERRGSFYVGDPIYKFAVNELDHLDNVFACHDNKPPGMDPVLSASYGDMARSARQESRPVILMQHGIGHTFGLPAYADGSGRNNQVDLWLSPHRYLSRKILEVHPGADVQIIGTPKSDSHPIMESTFLDLQEDNPPTIAIAFHWGTRQNKPPESGSAFENYKDYLETFAREQEAKGRVVIGHSHPSAENDRRRFFESIGVEYVRSFYDVMERADIYINDLSSTLYEFLLTGKPVIILNAPWFRRDKHFGIRFWDYSDVGVNVETPEGLCPAVEETIRDYGIIKQNERAKAVNDLFPYLGGSTARAVDVLVRYLEDKDKESRALPVEVTHKIEPKIQVLPEDAGVLYMSFGDAAQIEMKKSIVSIREKSGNLPIAVVGTHGLEGERFIEWKGESPFDNSQARNFHFRAGKVKPHFWKLTPFKRTLYLDCDTVAEQDIIPGFKYLDSYDFCIAQERHTILELYNVERGRWYHDMEEREYTMNLFGGNGNFPFINSGVFFWKQNDRTKALFDNWSTEWQRFQQWDEQAALLRALWLTHVKHLTLAETWNFPHRNPRVKIPAVITHLYGRGAARSNVS